MSGLSEFSSVERLPALIDRAAQRLLDAHTSAEVMEAKRFAEAALHYAKVTKAANDTHADCLRIITRAEIRMADEIDAGQAAGELATDGQHGEAVQTSDSLGIDRRRVSEWRDIRDAGPEAVEQAINEALSDGRTPTKSDIRNHVRGTFGTGNNEWYTPVKFIEAARKVMGGIDLDPASSKIAQEAVQADSYLTEEDNGLVHKWSGRVWLNPPYAQPHIWDFVEKLISEISSGNTSEAILLTHNYTDTAWFHHAESMADKICFTRGRVKFVDSDGGECSPTQGQAFFYYGKNGDEFKSVFGEFGFVR